MGDEKIKTKVLENKLQMIEKYCKKLKKKELKKFLFRSFNMESAQSGEG
jgi:Fe-S cluster biosynthesis and repair protein YggX